MKTEKQITSLTDEKCDVVMSTYTEFEDEKVFVKQVCDVYLNTPTGRALIQEKEPEYIAMSAITFWGNKYYEPDTAKIEMEE